MDPITDTERHPYVKDVFQMAQMSSAPNGMILWVNSNAKILKYPEPGKLTWTYRTEVDRGVRTFVPRVDMFSFPSKWWETVRNEYPDMIMGPDRVWSAALKDLMRRDGGSHLQWATEVMK